MLYGSGPWTLTPEHEKMIRLSQSKMLHLIVQTKRNCKKEQKMTTKKKARQMMKETTMGRTLSQKEKKNTSIGHGQYSNVSLECDIDGNLIDFIKRSTRDSEGKMRQFNISCWIQTQRKLKWRLPTRIAAHSEEIWTKKKRHDGTQTTVQQQERTEAWEDRRRDGRMTLTNSSKERDRIFTRRRPEEQRHLAKTKNNGKK